MLKTEEFSLFEGGGRGKQSNREKLKMLEKENAFNIISKIFSVDMLFFKCFSMHIFKQLSIFSKTCFIFALDKKVAKVF